MTLNPLSPIQLKPGELLLQTLRSHDQFNTTIYGENDRYRGIKGERRILFMHPEDMRERGIQAEDPLNITSHHEGKTAGRSYSSQFLMPHLAAVLPLTTGG